MSDLLNFCGNCLFHHGSECRRFPPQMAMWATDNQHPIMYTTHSNYPECRQDTPSCGEFRSKEARVLRVEI